MKLLQYLLGLVLMCCNLLSCDHKELCFDHSHIASLKVAFDWVSAPEANPESMSLYLFSEDGTNPQRYELSGREGGTIRVSPGIYHAICLNSDTRNIDCRDKEHISSFLVTTKDYDATAIVNSLGLKSTTLPRSRGTEDERMVREPEMLWIGCTRSFLVEEGTDNLVTLSPEESVIKLSISIYNVQNLRYVSGIQGTISGLSEGILAADGVHNGCGVTLPFALTKNDEGTALTAQMQIFGDCLSGNEAHYINLYLVLADGSKWNYSYDVTAQLHEADESNHIHLVLDELPIPKPEGGGGGGSEGGGFVPTIDGWKSVNIGIKM